MISFNKTCSKCGKEKDLSEFRTQSASTDLARNWCKLCDDQYNHDRYLRKKEKMRADAIKWRQEHPEEYRAIQAKYRLRRKMRIDKQEIEAKHNPPPKSAEEIYA
jgi:hypothetical protein